MNQIILLSGKLCSGKSSQAKKMVAATQEAVRWPLALELKKDIARLLGVTLEELEKPAMKEIIRPLYQVYGTDVMRRLHGDRYWPQRLMQAAAVYAALDTPFDTLVVDDVRFPSEVEYFQEYAEKMKWPFAAVRLFFPDHHPDGVSVIQSARYWELCGKELTDAIRLHSSETSLDGYGGWDMLFAADLPPDFIEMQMLEGLERRGFALNKTAEDIRGRLQTVS